MPLSSAIGSSCTCQAYCLSPSSHFTYVETFSFSLSMLIFCYLCEKSHCSIPCLHYGINLPRTNKFYLAFSNFYVVSLMKMKKRIQISFAKDIKPNFVSTTEIWFSGFCSTSLDLAYNSLHYYIIESSDL